MSVPTSHWTTSPQQKSTPRRVLFQLGNRAWNERMKNKMACCFKACSNLSDEALIQLEVYSLDWGIESGILQIHEQCFDARCNSDIKYDDPREHGHIPKNAKCVFCGDPLPRTGRHPYCFDIGNFSPPHRYWAHSQCMKAMLTPDGRENLPF